MLIKLLKYFSINFVSYFHTYIYILINLNYMNKYKYIIYHIIIIEILLSKESKKFKRDNN